MWHLTRSVSQSPRLTSVDVSPGKSLAVCFCLLLCCFSLCAFPLPCEKLLRVFVMSLSHFHGDQHWLTALEGVSSSQGPGEGMKECVRVWVSVQNRECVCGCIFTSEHVHINMWEWLLLTSVSVLPLVGSFFLSKGYCDVYLSDIDK